MFKSIFIVQWAGFKPEPIKAHFDRVVYFLVIAALCTFMCACNKERVIEWTGADKELLEKANKAYNPGRLSESLHAIKLWHENNSPAVAKSLKPGLNKNMIKARFLDLGVAAPKELIDLYSLHNGCDPVSNIPFIWYHDFLTLDQAISEYRNLMGARSLTGWRGEWFPVFQFQDEYYFVDCWKKDQIAAPVLHYFMEDTVIRPVFLNLTVMMETMDEIFQSNAVWIDKEWGALKDDIKRIKEIHEKHNPGLEFPYSVTR